jgi:hypothetical protein
VWAVELADEFEPELDALDEEVGDEILALARFIQEIGPTLGRPRVDTLKGSKHANMKELRLDASGGVWRMVFAFDPERKAILLVAGDKSGRRSEKQFYRALIDTADKGSMPTFARLKKAREEAKKVGGRPTKKKGSRKP